MSPDALADAFEAQRPYLRRLAYSTLGSLADADDVVQDAWLRLQRTDATEIRDLRAWLTTVVGRLALDALGSARRARRSSSTMCSGSRSRPSPTWSGAMRPPRARAMSRP